MHVFKNTILLLRLILNM